MFYVTFTITKSVFKSLKNKYRVLGGESWKEPGSLNQRLHDDYTGGLPRF